MEKPKLPERYDFALREPYWQNFWEEKKIFRFNPRASSPLYTIDTPPPTISGKLHLGHVFSYTQAEVIAAYRRMAGFNVRYPLGLDDNGLPTEKLVEKEEGLSPFQAKLSVFNQRCHEVIERFTPRYEGLFRKLGFRWDLGLEYSTISPEVQKLSQAVFLELFKRGVIYKETAPALYCPECRTSVAQAEVEDEEKGGVFYDLIFKKPDESELIIATTRPELLPACVAVFIHPKDKRYKDIVGAKVETSLGTKVKVFTDDKVSMEKGTGVVMCCTYGDTTDAYWKRTYGLSEKIVLDEEGRFTSAIGIAEIEGKTIEEGRKVLVEKLTRDGFIKGKRVIQHEVGIHERCGTPIEIIPVPQWFVRILEAKPQLLAAADQINWFPPYMKKRYQSWVEGLNWDWCISRGRFFGIPIPAFHCQKCEETILPMPEELPIDPRLEQKKRNCPYCNSSSVQPERGVLDTWFTSALTPDINNNHPSNGLLAGKMYPMSMRPQAHDIIRTWATYTILMGLLLHNEVPWKDIMISGHILVRQGEKISKKTGGGKLDPEKLVQSYSADAVRYSMCGASLSRDTYFDEKEVKKGQKLFTKIYNAGRLTLLNIVDFDPRKIPMGIKLEAIDQWVLFRAKETAAEMTRKFERYEFGQAREIFEKFFWGDFCDNYLEIIKGRIYGLAKEPRQSAQYALYHTYLAVLKMAAPFLPHITEEMHHAYIEETPGGGKLKSDSNSGYFFNNEGISSIHLCSWPAQKKPKIEEEIIRGAEMTLSILDEVRRDKTKQKMRLGESIPLLTIVCNLEQQNSLKPFLEDIKNFSRAEQVNLVSQVPFQRLSGGIIISL